MNTSMTPIKRLLSAWVCAGLLVTPALAGSDSEPAAMRAQAGALRNQAEQDFAHANALCQQKFLVNRCIDEARRARLAMIAQARELEINASRIELATKQREAQAAGVELKQPSGSVLPAPPTPSELPVVSDDSAANALRTQREQAAAEAEQRARAAQAREDAEKAAARAEAEAAAARRAEKAALDRQRYEERLRKREAELKNP